LGNLCSTLLAIQKTSELIPSFRISFLLSTYSRLAHYYIHTVSFYCSQTPFKESSRAVSQSIYLPFPDNHSLVPTFCQKTPFHYQNKPFHFLYLYISYCHFSLAIPFRCQLLLLLYHVATDISFCHFVLAILFSFSTPTFIIPCRYKSFLISHHPGT
jgi:hypothetical protein